jgi:hypothetical protein
VQFSACVQLVFPCVELLPCLILAARSEFFASSLESLVGAIGFEPTTPCAQGRCATRLRYAPTFNELPLVPTYEKSKAGALLKQALPP